MRMAKAMPRDKLWSQGVDALSDAELVAVLLGSGVSGRPAIGIANNLCHWVGGVGALSIAEPAELASEKGVGPAGAARIVAGFALGRRANATAARAPPSLRTPADCYRLLRGRLAHLVQEVFVAIALNSRYRVIEVIEIARGTLSSVDVHPREVFRPLVRRGAAAAVVAHNHPSGDPSPSPEDISLTRRLRDAGDVLGIPIVDHVIVTSSGYTSLEEQCGPLP